MFLLSEEPISYSSLEMDSNNISVFQVQEFNLSEQLANFIPSFLQEFGELNNNLEMDQPDEPSPDSLESSLQNQENQLIQILANEETQFLEEEKNCLDDSSLTDQEPKSGDNFNPKEGLNSTVGNEGYEENFQDQATADTFVSHDTNSSSDRAKSGLEKTHSSFDRATFGFRGGLDVANSGSDGVNSDLDLEIEKSFDRASFDNQGNEKDDLQGQFNQQDQYETTETQVVKFHTKLVKKSLE